MRWLFYILFVGFGGPSCTSALRTHLSHRFSIRNGGFGLKASNFQLGSSLPQIKCTSLATFSIIFLVITSSYVDIPIQPLYSSSVAHADSTGKMSTKLTARKRYLPRILDGVIKFNIMAQSPTSQESNDFLSGKDSQGASLIRAMNLYGASLRKGEVPDLISRRAEELTTHFKDDLAEVDKLRSVSSISEARKSLDAFLDFASLPKSLANKVE